MYRFIAGLILILLVSSTSAFALNPEPFTVRAVIRQVITIANTADLDFGTVEAVAVLYTVNPSVGPHTAGATAAAATFDIQGEIGITADVSVSPNPVDITGPGPLISVTLTVSSFPTHVFSGAVETLFVGGSMTPLLGQTSGTYTGISNLQLVYQ